MINLIDFGEEWLRDIFDKHLKIRMANPLFYVFSGTSIKIVQNYDTVAQ